MDVPSEKGSALCLAAHFDEKCVDLLLKAGADPNFPESNGWTPLHYGASSGGPTVIRRLLAAGALPATRSDVGESALDVARRYGHRDEEAVLNASETFPMRKMRNQ